MPKITLMPKYEVIPEGSYVFKITEGSYDADFGRLNMRCESTDGKTMMYSRFLLTKDGEANEGAIREFQRIARAAMKDDDMMEVDPEDLIGKMFCADVIHNVSGERTYVNLRNVTVYEADNADSDDDDLFA